MPSDAGMKKKYMNGIMARLRVIHLPKGTPDMDSSTPVTTPLVICLLVLLVFGISHKRRRYHPGPPGIPIFGNVFGMPKTFSWLVYLEWGRKYSE